MASADFLQFVVTMFRFEFVYSYAPARPPRVSVIAFTSYICCIYTLKFGQYWTSFWFGNSSVPKCLICSFCSSDRGFAVGFLQIPPHDGHPCLWLTVPTAKSVADFHRQVITHAERTNMTGASSSNRLEEAPLCHAGIRFNNRSKTLTIGKISSPATKFPAA